MSAATMDWLTDPPEVDEEQEPKRFYGVVTGTVIDLVDLMQLNRVQVQLHFIDDIDLSAWARIAVPMSGIACGMSFLPQVGDEVLVAFEHGDVNAPYIIGSLWNAAHPPIPNLPVPDSPVRTSYMIQTLAGNQLLMLETPPTVQIAAALAGQIITMDESGTKLTSASSVVIATAGAWIVVTATGIEIFGANLDITATTALSLKAPDITMTATGNCTIVGANVLINPV